MCPVARGYKERAQNFKRVLYMQGALSLSVYFYIFSALFTENCKSVFSQKTFTHSACLIENIRHSDLTDRDHDAGMGWKMTSKQNFSELTKATMGV